MSKAAVVGVWVLIVVVGADVGLRAWEMAGGSAAVEPEKEIVTVRIDDSTPVEVNLAQIDANSEVFDDVGYGFVPTMPVWTIDGSGEQDFVTVPVRVQGSVNLARDSEVVVVGGYMDVGIVD